MSTKPVSDNVARKTFDPGVIEIGTAMDFSGIKPKEKRTKILTVRITKRHLKVLKALSERLSCSQGDLIEHFLEEADKCHKGPNKGKSLPKEEELK